VESLGCKRQVVPLDQHARSPERLRNRCRRARDNGDAVGKRLDHGSAETLVHRHRQVHIGAAIPGVADVGGNRAGEEDPSGPKASDEQVEGRAVVLEAAVRADDDERGVGRPVPLVQRERLHDVLEAFVRNHSAHSQDDRLAVGGSSWNLSRQVEEEWDDGRVAEARLREVGRIESGHGEQRFDAASELSQVASAAVAVVRENRVETTEEISRRDIVVVEANPFELLERGRYCVGPDRVMEHCVPAKTGSVSWLVESKYQPFESRIDVICEDLAVVAPVREQRLPGKGLPRHCVARGGCGEHLVDHLHRKNLRIARG
jgi:hypothetical protein